MATDAYLLNESPNRFDRSMEVLIAPNGRKFKLNSISATTSSSSTALATSDAVGPLAQGALIVIQFANGTGGGWYSLSNTAGTVTFADVFVPDTGYQEYVYLWSNTALGPDLYINVMTKTASGFVNVFSVR
jgi:hypothetical protein